MTQTATARDDTIYVDDPEAKKFFELREHDAMLLQEGDLLRRKGRLAMVKKIKKKHFRGGGLDWTITLDDGMQFDPQMDFMPGTSEDMRNLTFWRSRKGF